MHFAKYRYEIVKWRRFLHTMSEKNAQYIKMIEGKFYIRIQPPPAVWDFFRFLKFQKSKKIDFEKKINSKKIIIYLDSLHFSDNNTYFIC